MTLIDISRTISPRTLVYPGDPPLAIAPLFEIGPQSPCRITSLGITTHTGTHLDAPAHFILDGATLDLFPLERFDLEALVIDVLGESIDTKDIPDETITRGRALLFRTRHSRDSKSDEIFDTQHVYMNREAAQLAATRGAALVGIDYLSIDRNGDESYPAHHALLGAGVLILEMLDLSQAPPGEYRLTAYPLKIANADGSPVRAVLRMR